MSSATSVLYLHEDIFYLIKHGHNIIKINPESKERLFDYEAYPTRIKTKIRASENNDSGMVGALDVEIPLYDYEFHTKPRWYVHPA